MAKRKSPLITRLAAQLSKKPKQKPPLITLPQFVLTTLLGLAIAGIAVSFLKTSTPQTPVPGTTNTLSPVNIPPITQEPGFISAFADQMYYVQAQGALVRSCPYQECNNLARLDGGSSIMVNAYFEGDAINSGNNVWMRGVYGGQIVYIYSSMIYSVQATAIPALVVQANAPVSSSSSSSNTHGWNCSGNRYDCRDFSSYSQAASYFNACPGDPSNLDGDFDGKPCEQLP